MRRTALLVVLLALLRCADSVFAFLSINTEALSSVSSAAVKPYLRIREVQRGTTGNPREDGTDLQHIAISLAHRTNPSVNDILIDSIDHVDSGLYRVAYTPIVSGQYDASITIKGDNISTNLSNGLTIRPARADAIKSTHNASPLVTEGIDETFTIQAIDRYGNELWSELPSKEDEFLVYSEGVPHLCSGREGDTIADSVDLEYSPEAGDVEADAEYSGGLYKASYTPTLAGTHQVSIRLRSVGGLLGTYFRNTDFTRPVWGNSDHVFDSHPANVPWCKPAVVECDSTRLDTNVMFDWGFGSPLRVAPNDNDSDDDDGDNKFPIDSFSAKWVGELKVPATDEYTFYFTLNGQARLVVGESVLVDTMANPSQSRTVSSETIELVVDTFYPITIEYIHHTDEALIQLEWSSWNISEKETVPSSALYYTRHLGNGGINQGNQNTNNSISHPSSPFPVEVLPGAIDLTSSPSSNVDVDDHEEDATIINGLNTCVATTECSFVIQTKDSEGNNRYNDGTDPAFVLSMTGTGGWAGDGRVNDDLTYSTKPLEVSPLLSVPLDWQYLDMVEVVHRSNQLTTGYNLLLKGLKRGDHVVVAGQTYTVSSSLDRIFDERTVPLDEAIIGPSMPSTALYKAGLGCDTGKHLITYTPQIRGEYALDVRLPPIPEVQRIQTVVPDEGPNLASLSTPSGTFTLTYRTSDGNMQTTADISYDANVDEMKEALENLSNLSEVVLGLDAYSCAVDGDPTSGCSWDVTFVGPDLEGDVELFMPNDGDLVGATVVVTELRAGIPARSISGFPRTVTVVPDAIDPAWTTAHGQGLVVATAGVEAEFTIQAKDDAGNDLLSNVDNPDALFEVTVTPEDGDDGAAIDGIVAAEYDGRYRVNYIPTKSGRHTINVVVKSMADGDVSMHIKKSPFRVLVDPAPINATSSVASDSPGVIHREGLSTGVYNSQTYFSVQLHDEFSNRVPEGPQSEVQIIEMWSLSPLSGTFDISYGNNKVTLPAGAGTAEAERAIQTLPGIGDVTVTTNAAKDAVAAADGRTVAVTTGLDTVVPSQRLDDEFSVGDWIRIGSRDDGPVFTIVAMSTATPFTVTLSSAHMGESDSAVAVYGQSLHGPPFGFQYIVSFDSTVGDVEALEVDGENLDNGDDETTISVTSCDHNVYQTIETHADDSDSEDPGALPSISGTFYLSYKGHRTPDLSASIDAASLQAIVEETFSSMDGGIRKVTVLGEVDLERGAKRWNLRLDDYDDDGNDQPSLLFAEGHLLSSGIITATAVCPIASSGDSVLEAPSHAGRSGQEFNIALIGVEDQGSDEGPQSSIVHGQAHYVADGLYEASYKSPRVGEYKLHIDTALSGGLYGRYYNNRWLFGSPIEERVDETIDFVWNDTHPVNEAIGNEFISVRWTGYIKAAFNEIYSFRMRVNDGARLWIGDELIIDEFDSIVEKKDEEAEMYYEYQGNTTMPMETSRLTTIKIEFQQNRGDASVHLEWSSETQPWSVVESYRLYHEGQPVDESPYIIHTLPIAPTEPRNCSATVVGAKSIQVHWMGPEDDGGEDVQSYRVVVQDVEASFVVFDETLLVQDLVDAMPMASYDDAKNISSIYSLDIGDDSKEMRVESAISIPLLIAGKQYGVQVSAGNSQDDHGPFCRQALVTPMSEPMAVKAVLLDRHPTSPTSLIVSFDPLGEDRSNGSEVSHYRIEWSTNESFGFTGDSTTNAIVQEATLLSSSQDNDNFILYEIQELEPGREYHVRVTAINAVGAGPPSSMPALLAPGSEPEPIEQNRFMLRIIEANGGGDGTDDDASVVTVGESSTSLLASWPIHPIHDDNGFAVEKYVMEYFVANEDVQSSSVKEPRIKKIEIDADAHNYTLTGLSPGQPISARIYAKNILGLSTATVAIPDELAPPRQPPSEPINVQLSRVDGGRGGGGSSLSVSWDPPTSDGGDAISKYLVEHSTDEDFPPSSTDFGAYTKVDCQDNQRCRHTILGLIEGVAYYVRVFAGNSYGFSRTSLSQPTSLAPMNPPDRLDRVNIATDTSDNGQHIVDVSWRRRADESGSIVGATSVYKVEWVETNLYQDYTTQRIQASGSFRLSFQGHKTKILAADSSAYRIKQALESLPTIGSAEVLKEDVVHVEGPTYTSSWLATFPNFRHMEKMQIELGGASTETDPAAVVEYVVEAYQGYEIQSVSCERCLDTAAQREQSFRLSHLGNATAALPLSITPSALEAALRDIGVGDVEVSRRTDRNIQGYEWTITFTSLLGDLPLLQTVVDPHSEVKMYVGEVAKGQLPPMTGGSYGSLVVSAREAEAKADANGWIHWSVEIPRKRKPYYFQASASNEVGFGPPMYSTPPTI